MTLRCPACLKSEAVVHVTEPLDIEYFRSRQEPTVIQRCSHCFCLYQDPWPTTEETHSFYDADYQNYMNCSSRFVKKIYKSSLNSAADAFIHNEGKHVSVLDYGCGQGHFLECLAEKGVKKLAGYDVVTPLNSHAHINYYNNLQAIQESGEKFDLIRMNHVIEHLAELDTIMTTLSSLLTAQGKIIGQTPNAAHYTAKIMASSWGGLHYPYHTILFSPQGLKIAAPRWGLQLTQITSSVMPTGWAMSLENKLKKILHSQTKGRTAFYIFCLLSTAPFVLFDYLLGNTAIINFYLNKND